MKYSEVSKLFLETIPPAMHLLRRHVRKSSNPCLSVPQFRVLINIERGLIHVGEIAEHHGISQPGMSKLVDGLVAREFICKSPSKTDGRVIELRLTRKGKSALSKIKEKAIKDLTEDLEQLNSDEIIQLFDSLKNLNSFISQLKEKSLQ